MIAGYRITEQDYVNATRLYAQASKRSRTLQIVLGLFLGCVLFFYLALSVSAAVFTGFAVGGIAVGIFLFWLFRHVVIPLTARVHYQRYKGAHEEFTVELRDEGLRFTSPHGQGTLIWAHMLKWRQNDDYVLIYPMPRLFHIVPKSLATQGFDVPLLTERLRTHVGAPV